MFDPNFRKRVEPWIPPVVKRWIDPFHTLLNDRLRAAAQSLPPGSWVLDAGAGECPHRPMFAHCHYVTLDKGIGDVRWDYSKVGVVGDILELPFKDRSFDAVINIQVLEHIHEPGQAINEFTRVLKPGGKLVLTTVMCWEIHQHPNDFFRYTKFGLEYLFRKAGLRIGAVEALGGFFWLLAFRLMNLLSFFQRGWRWIVFVLLAPWFGFLVPTLLYYMDPLDRKRDYTLGYFCWCEKGAEPSGD